MKVSIKDLQINMDLGNNGVIFSVYDNAGTYLGDLRLGKATIEWCKGRTRSGNGNKVSWQQLTEWLESQ